MAPLISLSDKVISFGKPLTRSRPFITASDISPTGIALPIVIFILSAVFSPIDILYSSLIKPIISLLSLSPANFILLDFTVPPSDSTAISVVPPPMSTIITPSASCIGSPAPIAAAIGSSIIYTSLAPAAVAASYTALVSTLVISQGIPITTRGRNILFCILFALFIK